MWCSVSQNLSNKNDTGVWHYMLIPSRLGLQKYRERSSGEMVGVLHLIPSILLHHHWNIIRCLLTFKSCSAAVVSIGLATISVKCPLTTLLLLMEDFLSPSMASFLSFASLLHPSYSLPYTHHHPNNDTMEDGNLLH